MKIITSALALLTVLSVSLLAQTSSAEEPILQIKSFGWVENVAYIPCNDCAGLPQVALDYRNSNRAGRGDFLLRIVLKNRAKKSIKSVSLDFVFRDAETEREFLTYHHRFEQEIGSGNTEVIRHEIKEGTELHNFRPIAPSSELLGRTRYCRNGPWLREKGSRKLVKIRDNPKLVKAFPCYYLPSVTRIEYLDGSIWRP
ncbi:MAG TPA: hypothetical protein VFZ71_12905 [Pyrinomonadaceae bacterium]